jgi:hypothetical protein
MSTQSARAALVDVREREVYRTQDHHTITQWDTRRFERSRIGPEPYPTPYQVREELRRQLAR